MKKRKKEKGMERSWRARADQLEGDRGPPRYLAAGGSSRFVAVFFPHGQLRWPRRGRLWRTFPPEETAFIKARRPNDGRLPPPIVPRGGLRRPWPSWWRAPLKPSPATRPQRPRPLRCTMLGHAPPRRVALRCAPTAGRASRRAVQQRPLPAGMPPPRPVRSCPPPPAPPFIAAPFRCVHGGARDGGAHATPAVGWRSLWNPPPVALPRRAAGRGRPRSPSQSAPPVLTASLADILSRALARQARGRAPRPRVMIVQPPQRHGPRTYLRGGGGERRGRARWARLAVAAPLWPRQAPTPPLRWSGDSAAGAREPTPLTSPSPFWPRDECARAWARRASGGEAGTTISWGAAHEGRQPRPAWPGSPA